jgi:hypothetical protein
MQFPQFILRFLHPMSGVETRNNPLAIDFNLLEPGSQEPLKIWVLQQFKSGEQSATMKNSQTADTMVRYVCIVIAAILRFSMECNNRITLKYFPWEQCWTM